MDFVNNLRDQFVKATTVAKVGKDAKYFSGTSKGEIPEWKNDLHSTKPEVVRDAIKKVIAAMTVGKDVSSLFPDVVNCMQTDSQETKKLTYLYLINYAKTNPDMAIMAVNTFVKDTTHPSPLIRGLAVRTMGCIRIEKISEYLCQPLLRALIDEDPYVRKTGAMCVAKLYDISPAMVKEKGFMDKLRDLISDANPMVVANAVAALAEIESSSGRESLEITASVLQKLLAALNECSEWGQVFILDYLAKYNPADEREAENIIERVVPRLAHQNSAVVLSAVKIVMRLMEHITNPETINNFGNKLSPTLVTLCQSTQPEIQYVALRNVNLIVQKRPNLLVRHVKVFFCKYHEPSYVKLEKLDILVKLATERNIESVLAELKEYASEVDVEFVRKSVRTIGRCAIKLERAAEKCIKKLLELIETKVNYVVQEAVVVIKDIFRKYPNRYESVIGTLCDALDTLDEPEAKASMVWIIGEYSNRIENADELLDTFLESFHDEPSEVQLQLLTATIKLFLRRPSKAQEMVTRVLRMATEESDNPDLRDRGYVYWRLLSVNPQAAKQVVLSEKPKIADDTSTLPEALLDTLIANISTLAAIYHKPPETFVTKEHVQEAESDTDSDDDDDDEDEGKDAGHSRAATAASAPAAAGGGEPDLLGLGPAPEAAKPVASGGGANLLDLFGAPPAPAPAPAASSPGALLGQGGHLSFYGGLERQAGRIVLKMALDNQGAVPTNRFDVKFNLNSFGITPSAEAVDISAPAGGRATALLPCMCTPGMVARDAPPSLSLDIAVRSAADGTVVFMKNIPVPFHVLYKEGQGLDPQTFISMFSSTAGEGRADVRLTMAPDAFIAAARTRLTAANINFAAQRPAEGVMLMYFYAKTETEKWVLMEIMVRPMGSCSVTCKCDVAVLAQFAAQSVQSLLQ